MTDFTDDDRQAICDMFNRLLMDQAHEEQLRKIIETPTGFDKTLWLKMAELGLTGIMIDPDQGGIGGSIEEVEAIMEVSGAYLYNGPYISTCVLAPSFLKTAENSEFTVQHLENIAAGASIFAVAGCGMSGDWFAKPEVTAVKKGEEWELSGKSSFVRHARNADHVIVAASDGDGLGVFCLPTSSSGVTVHTHETDDQTLRLSTLKFDQAKAVHLEGVGQKAFDRSLQLALAALAGEQSGAARRIFEMTIEYLNTRYQFGQPIGRFQALKHMAAELLIEVESASSAARHAARALASGVPNAAVLTYLAAFTCADNFRKTTADAIQLHGGIAYTMEHPAHLYWRRAQTGQWLFGSSDQFRELYLSQMEAML